MSEAQRKAKEKYLREKVETIAFRVPVGQKEVIRAHAAKVGESMNAFIARAVKQAMLKDDQSN